MGAKRFSDLDLIAALNLHENNVTRTAHELGVSRQAVIKRKKTLPDGVLTPDIDEFRKKRADIFASIQQVLLQHITPQKLKTASLQQIGTLFGIMYDKERLEKNLATEHIAHAHFQSLPRDQMQEIKNLSKKLTEQKLNKIKY